MSKLLQVLTIALLLSGPSLSALAAEQHNLPTLGDSTSGIISLNQERALGQHFLRSVRARTETVDDPILQDYLEHLIYRLASNSQLTDRRIDLIIIKSPSLNAFAAPGGIIGVNHGLFSYAETEQEISAILAHELAHLSQRHFARQLGGGKKASVVNMAGLLAGVILMATTGADAGLAALAGAQGYSQNQLLKYSREREAEADRIGIYTLAESDMDPRAMAYMFERLQRASRYNTGDRIPEFLRTHPVTKSRISDAYNQTQQYPKQTYPLQLDYQLMRARAKAITSNAPDLAQQFEAKLATDNRTRQLANQYGLALVLTDDLEFDRAQQHIRELRDAYPYNIAFRIAEADTYRAGEQHDDALEILEEALALSPDNYPLSMTYAETFIAARRPHAALDVLVPISISRPNDEHIWYMLAEAYGLANNIPGVHEARAEYFVLNGAFDQAIKQLGYALPLVRNNFQQSARIKQRMEDIWDMKGS